MMGVFFGLVALVVPVVSVARCNKSSLKARMSFPAVSLSACALAVLCQLLLVQSRAEHGDISGILDTIGAEVIISVVLIAVTVILNLFSIVVNYVWHTDKKEDRHARNDTKLR